MWCELYGNTQHIASPSSWLGVQPIPLVGSGSKSSPVRHMASFHSINHWRQSQTQWRPHAAAVFLVLQGVLPILVAPTPQMVQAQMWWSPSSIWPRYHALPGLLQSVTSTAVHPCICKHQAYSLRSVMATALKKCKLRSSASFLWS